MLSFDKSFNRKVVKEVLITKEIVLKVRQSTNVKTERFERTTRRAVLLECGHKQLVDSKNAPKNFMKCYSCWHEDENIP